MDQVCPRDLAPNRSIKLTDIHPQNSWQDADGAFDLTWFAVQDRSVGGGVLTLDGTPLLAGIVYEGRIDEIDRYGFTTAASSAVDEIGFNVIQLNGDYSPSFALGAGSKVTTQPASGTGGTGTPTNPGTGTTTGSKADLVPTITEVSATQYAPGGVLTVRFKIDNVGQQSALGTATGVFLSADGTITTADRLIGTHLPGTIPAGASDNGSVEIIIPDDMVGSFQVGVWADYTQKWTENVESNNIATQAVTIGPMAASQADLEFRQAYLTKTRVLFGETIALEASVRNTGEASSARTDVRVYLSTNTLLQPDRDVWLTQNQISEIQVGRGRSAYSEFTITLADVLEAGGTGQSQNLFLIAVIDEERSVADRDRSDNVMVRRITIADEPSNWIGYSDNIAYDMVLSDDIYGAGDQVQFTVKLKNQGTIDVEDAPGFGRIADLIWRSVATGLETALGSSRVDDNYARGKEFLTFGQRFFGAGDLAPGYYDVFARVRADAAEPLNLRTNNESNSARVFFGSEDQRRLLEMPDLSVEALTITRDSSGALSAHGTVANKGGLAVSAGTTVGLFVERTDGTGFQLVKSGALDALDASAGGSPVTQDVDFINVQLPYLAAGEYRAGLILDIFDVVDEAEAGNNLREGLLFQSDGTVSRQGDALSNILEGGPGPDTLHGLAGSDTLVGGAGNDSLDGGSDSDTAAFAGNQADYAITSLGGGLWRVQDLRLGSPEGADTLAGVEFLHFGDTLFVLGGAQPTEGADSLNGTAGADTIDALGGNDRVLGLDSADSLLGGAGDDTLDGGGGADTLNGGTGADSTAGGTGNDSYVVDAAGDRIVETRTGGADTVHASITWTLGAHLEDLVLLGDAPINGTGNNLSNVITGNDAANVLIGAGRPDTLIGGGGNDLYLPDATDTLIEQPAGGYDIVILNATFALSDHIEELRFNGTANARGDGNASANLMVGNIGDNRLLGYDGNDTLNGGLGNDTLQGGEGADSLVGGEGLDRLDGGPGDDSYLLGDGDQVIELANAGLDTVLSNISYTLPNAVENLTLLGSADIAGAGNALDNVLFGNGGANLLRGLGGADSIAGGQAGDTLEGGAGADTLTGSGGADRFLWLSPADGGDTLLDFRHAEDQLAFAAGGFGGLATVTLSQNAASGGAAQFIYTKATGALQWDADGTGASAAVLIATLTSKPTLAATDFVIV